MRARYSEINSFIDDNFSVRQNFVENNNIKKIHLETTDKNPENKKELALTEKQETFLTALFGEARGNPKAAGDIAGYADYLQPLRALKDEIITRAEEQLAAFAPRASMGMINALDEDGSLPGANIRMEAAKQILDRVGLSKKEKLDSTAKGGVVLAICKKFELPIVAVGMGEKETDLQPFNAEYFSKALLGIEN